MPLFEPRDEDLLELSLTWVPSSTALLEVLAEVLSLVDELKLRLTEKSLSWSLLL
ncbi:hypothetical protein LWM68_38860 [Niabella sp. W65]|nr:hypothetical protein [Niabella sp. W65]MCH7368173.1 hypothetical protein [Niabella sp. W65]ULT43787.1 hypothetical protein KRR40_10525 [Niabella sp. I65]